MVDDTVGDIGEASVFLMTTLGGTSWGRFSWGQRTGRSMERYLVLVYGRVVRFCFVRAVNVSLDHC